jgi:hypothetical protein
VVRYLTTNGFFSNQTTAEFCLEAWRTFRLWNLLYRHEALGVHCDRASAEWKALCDELPITMAELRTGPMSRAARDSG